jgi:hypothetical protein
MIYNTISSLLKRSRMVSLCSGRPDPIYGA